MLIGFPVTDKTRCKVEAGITRFPDLMGVATPEAGMTKGAHSETLIREQRRPVASMKEHYRDSILANSGHLCG